MICRRCLFRLARPSSLRSRQFSSLPARTSAAEPFTVPPSMSPSVRGNVDGAPAKQKDSITLQSSVPAGTRLKGLNIYKGKDDPVAMEDSEYPDWLWGVLREIKGADASTGALSSSKKVSKKAAKRAASQAQDDSMATTIPINEQTIDLPIGDGTEAGVMQAADANIELRKALRAKRRAAIKEANFLRTMN